LRLRQREAGLERLQAGGCACLKAFLRGVARARRERLELLCNGDPTVRGDDAEIGPADIGAQIGGDPRGLRVGDGERRVGDIDAPLPLSGNLDRHAAGERPVWCFLVVFEPKIRVRPLARDCNTADVNRSGGTRGNCGRAGFDGPCQRLGQ
jgi:hypothetical protein